VWIARSRHRNANLLKPHNQQRHIAIPQQWDLNSEFCGDKNTVIENFIEKLRLNGKTVSGKSSYCFLFSKLILGPTKQQVR